MPARAFVFDAYGTLFRRSRGDCPSSRTTQPGPDATAFPRSGGGKQLEYAWMLSAAGRYVDFWTLDAARARFTVCARALGRPAASGDATRCLLQLDAFPTRARRARG